MGVLGGYCGSTLGVLWEYFGGALGFREVVGEYFRGTCGVLWTGDPTCVFDVFAGYWGHVFAKGPFPRRSTPHLT